MQVLIPHGVSPTGFGLILKDNGHFRPISPCCGVKLESDGASKTILCTSCNKDYYAVGEKLVCSLSNDIGPVDMMTVPGSGALVIVTEWAGKLTGWGDALKITVS